MQIWCIRRDCRWLRGLAASVVCILITQSFERPMQRAYLSIFAQRAHRTGSRLIVWRMEYPLPVRPGGFWPCTD
jgi:hypothetical protein